MIDDFSKFDISIQLDVLAQNPKNIDHVSDQAKLKFLISEFLNGEFSQFYYDIYSNINLINQDYFEAFCILQQIFDEFDKFFIIKKVEGDEESIIDRSNNKNSIFINLNHNNGNIADIDKTNHHNSLEDNHLINISKQTQIANRTYFKYFEVFSEYLSIHENLFIKLVDKCERKNNSMKFSPQIIK